MNLIRSQDVALAFLSCGVRPSDLPLVDALERGVLAPSGFKSFTIGRNVSLPEQTDDAVKRLISACDCLIGVATERSIAREVGPASSPMRLATPYLLQETSMAFQLEMPFLIFRTEGVTLQGVTNRNLYLEILRDVPRGRVRFKSRRELVSSALADLKQKALAHRAARRVNDGKKLIGWLSSIAVGATVIAKGVDVLMRPTCFGEFYYRDPTCHPCRFKADCKVKKLEIQR